MRFQSEEPEQDDPLGRKPTVRADPNFCGKGLHEWTYENVRTRPDGYAYCYRCQYNRKRGIKLEPRIERKKGERSEYFTEYYRKNREKINARQREYRRRRREGL